MIRCPLCNGRFVPDSPAAENTNSRQDQASLDEHADWMPVARTSSVAEAGFLCDLLLDVQIRAQLQELDDFEAITGAWRKIFVVVVPKVQSDQAAERLQYEMDRSAEDEDFDDEPSSQPTVRQQALPRDDHQTESRIPTGAPLDHHVPDAFFLDSSGDRSRSTTSWLPMALALVAGGVASWLASDWLAANPQAGLPEQQSMLWNALKETDAEWTTTPIGQRPARGVASRTLRYEGASGTFVLEEDLDGDQQVDRRRQFRGDATIFDRQ